MHAFDPPQRTLGWFLAASSADPLRLSSPHHTNSSSSHPGRLGHLEPLGQRVHGATVFHSKEGLHFWIFYFILFFPSHPVHCCAVMRKAAMICKNPPFFRWDTFGIEKGIGVPHSPKSTDQVIFFNKRFSLTIRSHLTYIH